MGVVTGGGGGGGSLPVPVAEGVVLRAAADTHPAWTDQIRVLDDGTITIVDGFVIITSSGLFKILNVDAETIARISRSAVTLGRTTGTPHGVAVSSGLGVALFDSQGNIAVQVDPNDKVLMPTLPATDPGVSKALWRDASGFVKASA